MIKGRWCHASGTLVDHGTKEKIPVVSGGLVHSNITSDSTEFLVNGIWTKGKLPIMHSPKAGFIFTLGGAFLPREGFEPMSSGGPPLP